MSSSNSLPNFPKLDSTNYPTWAGNMEAWFRSSGLWRIVSAQSKKPRVSTTPTATETTAVETWETKSDKAAGWLFLMVEDDQKVHFNEIKDDPVKMWTALEAVHMQKRPGHRFNAYDDLFSIRKQEDETLQTLINRVDAALRRIQDLRPTGFDLKQLDDELASMAMIRALPEEYSAFTSSLLLLDKLDKATIHQAFVGEEIQRRRRASDLATALSASSSSAASSATKCEFCGMKNHTMEKCYKFINAQKLAKDNSKKRRGGNESKANKVQETSSENTQSKDNVVEFAENASALSSTYDPSNPSNPLQSDADFDWNADTGATSHMTPHRHWLRNYSKVCIPIKLADHTIVYAVGVGSVRFVPQINGKESRSVEWTRVLHVPQLRNNLLSVLYLTCHKGFEVHINSKCMNFKQNGTILFSASIQPNNCAMLNGVTEPISEYANIVSTLPLDINLWHRRFAHHNYADIQKMINEELVTGLVLDTKQQPDPICEPCLAGKMHSNPFPNSQSHYSEPLELIHTDLHGPLPVATPEGYRYWIIFIDACKRFRVGVLLKKKSDAFKAFKLFKAYAENQLGCKIKAMQDDKAGEYMSQEFIDFTDSCGIIRRHTTRNRPQMNGVAERANRTISNDITAMITESNLPPSFWGLCFAAHFHVWNRLPTAPLPHTTPFEGWFKKKPDVGHLRVWGCTAYVHIQRDKRKSLQSHMEKCIFVGYPSGYKGWKFYNPTTKKYIISERAEFDERYFPGLSVGSLPKINLQVPSSN